MNLHRRSFLFGNFLKDKQYKLHYIINIIHNTRYYSINHDSFMNKIHDLEKIFDIKISKSLIHNIRIYLSYDFTIFKDRDIDNIIIKNQNKIINILVKLGLDYKDIELFKIFINSQFYDEKNITDNILYKEDIIANVPLEFVENLNTLNFAKYYILYIEKGFKFDWNFFNKKLKALLDKAPFKEVYKQRKGKRVLIKKYLDRDQIYKEFIKNILFDIIQDLKVKMNNDLLDITNSINEELLLIDENIKKNKINDIIDSYKKLGIYKYSKNIKYNENKIYNYKIMLENIDNYIKLNKNKLTQFNLESKLNKGISNILNNDILSLKDKQIKIEEFLLMYENNYIKENVNEFDLKLDILYKNYEIYKNILNNIVNNYTINNYDKFFNSNDDTKFIIGLLILLDKDIFINIFIKELIKTLFYNELTPLTHLLGNVGRKIIKYYNYKLSKNDFKKDLFKRYDFILNHIKDIDITDIIEIKLGQLILESLDNGILFEKYNLKNKNKTITYVKFNNTFLDKFKFDSIKDIHLPMIYTPNYNKPYLTDELNYSINIITNSIENVLKTELNENNYKIINHINKQKFKINKDLLLIILKEWNNNNSKLFKGYNKLHYKTDYKNLSKNDLLEVQQHNSKYYNYMNIINIALLYKDYEFYLPTYYDFRGRIYTFNNYLTYQGSDLARSLILFCNGSNINEYNKKYLIYYLCNTIGLNKESLENKLLYYKNNEEKLIQIFLNNDFDSISKFKEPFQFISIINSIINIKYNNIIYNPILFDATCNGLQHLSAMCTEIDLAFNNNLLYSELPNDMYDICIKHLIDDIKKLDNEILKNKLLNINITRNFIKKAIMTISYNITLIGLANDMEIYFTKNYIKEINNYEYIIKNEFNKDINNKLSLNSSEYYHFIKMIHNILYSHYPKLEKLIKYFNGMIDIFNIIEKPFYWITPIGMIINHKYVKFESKKIKNSIIDSKYITISLPTNKINHIKQKLAFIPNMVHSLDASNIHLLVLELIHKYDKIPIYTIHDCFASNLDNISKISYLVKLKFIEIYFFDNYYLDILHLNLINQIKEYYIIYNDNDNDYILHNNKKVYIPKKIVPNIEIIKLIKSELLNSKYFLS